MHTFPINDLNVQMCGKTNIFLLTDLRDLFLKKKKKKKKTFGQGGGGGWGGA